MTSPEINKTYNLATCFVAVGPVVVSGYSEDGGLEYEEGGDLFEDQVGSDGESVSSRVNNHDVYCNISLMETSKAYRDLMLLLEAQLLAVDAGTPITPLPFAMNCSSTGDTCLSLYTTFMARPPQTKGRTAGERVFRLKLNKPKRTYGLANQV